MAFVELTQVGHVGILTMNRPEVLNALSDAMFKDLIKALDEVERNDDIYVFIITGAGRAFVAGADISEMTKMNVAQGKALANLGNSVFLRIENMEKPSIAAVNGFALGGGCEMALSCDIRIASEKAKFGQPEVGLGIIPGFGGTQRMARIVGTGHALEMILSGKIIDANYAKEIGMINRVVSADELMPAAMELAETIANQAQLAVRSSKQAVRRGIQCDMDTAATYEALSFAICFDTEDQKDAMQAFVEKRKLGGFKNC